MTTSPPQPYFHPDDYDDEDFRKQLFPETVSSPRTVDHLPTLQPLPGSGRHHHDEHEETTVVAETPPVPSKAIPGTMVLVIGIILGAFVAMIIIVIIVLKTRTRVVESFKAYDEHCPQPAGMPVCAAQGAAPRCDFVYNNYCLFSMLAILTEHAQEAVFDG
jgi:hypothetical protein